MENLNSSPQAFVLSLKSLDLRFAQGVYQAHPLVLLYMDQKCDLEKEPQTRAHRSRLWTVVPVVWDISGED
jgi:hypothetical protein